MTDADVDGSHIRTLLLTFFYRQFPEMVRGGHVYIAQPPLFRADLGKERNYLKDEAALRAFEADHEGRKIEVSRFKGLGEMDWQELGELVRGGHVYVAQPPLFRADIGKERTYLKDEAALRVFEAEHEGRKIDVNRFKGLGEMDWHELKETTMDPRTRNLLRVDVEDAAIADDIFSRLMGDDVDSRKTFIQTNAKDVRFIDA